MRTTLRAGLTSTLDYVVPQSRTVPSLLPESPPFSRMPRVLATGYLVGLVEWTCMELLQPHLDGDERTLGTHIELSHESPTIPGAHLRLGAELTEIEGRTLTFNVFAHDEYAQVCRGRHQRAVIDLARFVSKLRARHEDAT
ncbi:thioesterase family protein [Mycolicibacterium sp. S2-37]|uniref:thioesterase family protein n=1 Tax=Mycolicibacterium sp. S2-37 TaxID=2810297 RepID=UPI0035AB75A5